jgi:hypothetical protein
VDYWLLFWHDADGDLSDEQVAARLRRGDWTCTRASDRLLEFRRDLIASDPDWATLRLLPHPGSAEPADRYLALLFAAPPAPDELRDLRYVAARNRLKMVDAGVKVPPVSH